MNYQTFNLLRLGSTNVIRVDFDILLLDLMFCLIFYVIFFLCVRILILFSSISQIL